MKYSLVKLDYFTGSAANLYSLMPEGGNETLLDAFVRENLPAYPTEVQDILKRLRTIVKLTGAREHYFKQFEGRGGDHVCALFDSPGSKLRLYCIRLGMEVVIIGGGAPKSKKISALQQDPLLTMHNTLLRKASVALYEKLREKEIRYIFNGHDIEGDFIFDL